MSRHWVQFTARKRREDGDRYMWRHGPYAEREEAEAHAARMRVKPGFARCVRIEVLPAGRLPR